MIRTAGSTAVPWPTTVDPVQGRVYRLDPDGSHRVVIDRVTISNGMDWAPDGSLVYYNDTETGQVDVFDYDADAGLTRRRRFVEIADGGQPDGLTVDEAGGVWVAISNGGTVHRYAPNADLDEVIEVPARKVTA